MNADASDARTVPASDWPQATGEQAPQAEKKGLDLAGFLRPPERHDELGRLGKYRILRVLGHGGMGIVFQAEDTSLKRLVALKALRPGLPDGASAGPRFLREAQAMAAVKHDHVATIHQVDEDRGVPFLAMELLAGESLERCLKREGKLPVPEVLRIGREIAEGLEAAHATGLIHRDIKPANIWLEAPRGRVKILDFGLARMATANADLTQEGAIMGTAAYMAPEQARGDPVDVRTDLFSLGCVLYRMLTGQPAFQGKTMLSTLLAVASHQPSPPVELSPEIPRSLSELVLQLLEKDATRRPSSAAAVAEVLGGLERSPVPNGKLHDDTLLPRQAPSPAPAAQARRPRKLLLAAACLLVLLPLGWWLATALFRVQTPTGTLVVEIDDPRTEALIKDGKLVLTRPDGTVRYTLAPGERNRELPAGPYGIHVEGADGLTLDTEEFTLQQGGKVLVRVTAAPPPPQKPVDSDRAAAEWVLSIGGMVSVSGQARQIRTLGELPAGPFRLTGVYLQQNRQVSNASLAHFMGCKKLASLNLDGIPISDAALAHLEGCKELAILHLGRTQVTDAGLVHFKDCKNLTALSLYHTRVSDAGLAHFRSCKNLRSLDLSETQVSDTGLALFKSCKNLNTLLLRKTRIGDEGLAPFKDCKSLTLLALGGTRVTDAGLAELQGCTGLVQLELWETRVTDAGLACCKSWKNLRGLFLGKTSVTEAGLAHLEPCKNLARLGLAGTQVRDLSPLSGLPLVSLHCQGAHVTDLAPLKHLPLKELSCDFVPARDTEVLRAITTLEKINGKPVKQLWKEVAAGKP